MDDATIKGWKLVADILNDDDKYTRLRQGYYIILRGSNGKDYVLYPNGGLAVLGKSQIKQGHISGSDFCKPDYLATLIAWILFDADRLDENWGCGSLSLQREHEAGSHEPVFVPNWHGHWYDDVVWLKLAMIVLPLIFVMVWVFPSFVDGSLNFANLTVGNTTGFENITTIAVTVMPIFMILAVALSVIKSSRW